VLRSFPTKEGKEKTLLNGSWCASGKTLIAKIGVDVSSWYYPSPVSM